MKYLLSVAALANLTTSIGFPESELAQIGAECHHNSGCCGCMSSCCHNHCHSPCDGHDDDGTAGGGGGNDGTDLEEPLICPPNVCPSLSDDGSVSALLTIASSPDQGWAVFAGADGCMDYCEFKELWECLSDWGPFGWSGPGSDQTAVELWDQYNTNGDGCMILDEF